MIAEAEQERQAAVDRHAEDHGHEEQDEEQLDEGEDEVGEELAEDDRDGGGGRHHELLERAALALAHDRERREERAREGQQDRDQARDEEVGAPRVRVEEQERVSADRKVLRVGALRRAP